MTEDQAREKWCPFARKAAHNGAINRDGNGTPNTRCIASECMAWRTGTKTTKQPSAQHSGIDIVEVDVGYCGLAGKQ